MTLESINQHNWRLQSDGHWKLIDQQRCGDKKVLHSIKIWVEEDLITAVVVVAEDLVADQVEVVMVVEDHQAAEILEETMLVVHQRTLRKSLRHIRQANNRRLHAIR